MSKRIAFGVGFVILFLVGGFYSYGQDNKSLFGNKLVFQIAYGNVNFPFSKYPENKNDASYRIGGEIGLYISERISIGTGISYERKKYFIDYTHSTSQAVDLIMETYDLSYVCYPLVLGFDLVQAGPHTLALLPSFEIQSVRMENIRYYFDNGYSRDGEDDLLIDHPNTISLGVFYKYAIQERFFLGICPKIRYNGTSESTELSWLVRFSLGYILPITH